MENKMIQNIRERLVCCAEIYQRIAEDLTEKDPKRSEQCFGEAEIFRGAAEAVVRLETAEAEIEGGGSTWWYVCGECRAPISPPDHFCRMCGRPLEWGKTTFGNTQD